MISFVFMSVISAGLAIWEVQIGATSESSLRGQGLTTHPGVAALWFLLSFVFLLHLRESSNQKTARFIYLLLMGIIFLGIVATVARTVFLVFLIILLWMFFSSISNKSPVSKFRPIFLTLVISALIVSPQYWLIAAGIPYSILEATGSIGFRYMQWKAGLGMFFSHSIAGVGIGQFTEVLPFYRPEVVPFYGLGYSAHSIYVALLAETGMVGFLLYACWMGSRIKILVYLVRQKQSGISSLAWTWLVAIIAILLVGTTADVQYNKFLWIALSSPLLSMSRRVQENIPNPAIEVNVEKRLDSTSEAPAIEGDMARQMIQREETEKAHSAFYGKSFQESSVG